MAYQPCSQVCRVAVATGRSSFAVATELADYRGVEASRGGLPLPRAASAQAGRHGRPAGQHRWRRSWRAQWASTPSGLRARGGLCGWRSRVGVNAVTKRSLCGNRELASARRHGHPLRQRAGEDGAGESGPLFSLARPIFSQACRVAVATGRSSFAVATERVRRGGVDARVATRPSIQPRARRPGATDARRASPGGPVRPAALQTSKKYTENQPLALAVYRVIAI